jgi:hypothetical protein
MLKQILPYVFPILIFALVTWRMSRASRGRPLKPSRLWIRPAILLVFGGLAFLHPAPITPLSTAIFAVCAAVGVGLGYVLARHQHLTLDAATGAITSKLSPVGMALFVALFAVRYFVRMATVGGAAPGEMTARSPQMLLYTDAALLFALGLVAAQSWETWRRARALLAETAPKKPESLAG